ncbi:TonB-dependent siderophore receptor [Aliarcobacter butzleri]|uniref:TonB-dependent siderophore receptor n=1 Tax=Aliarcobacter butzleri TaxID=28197 RepID=UPI00125F89FD|nr:TonB-dependent siderophore receptor [Aliarcobacter butzleri]MDN5089704.1 TonB-dependent siderophore receptor [Aliarcobacter butzleri]
MMHLKAKIITSASAILLCGSLFAQDVYTVKNMSLKQALEKISKESKLAYIVDESLISGKTAPNIENVQGLKNALNQVLNGSGLEATIEKGTIIIEKIVGQGTVLETISVNEGYSNGSAQSGYVVKELKQVGFWGEKSLQDTPYSMTVMPQELIENSISGDMDQIYKMNPVTQSGATTSVYGTPYATIRGFSTQSGIIDGLRLSSVSLGISMEELERVEILNGLSGFMYGAGNVGGTTNYVLKRPTYKRLTNLTLGNYGNEQYYTHLDLGDKIDEKGEFAYRLNASYQDGETSKDDQNVERKLISGALDWNVTDNFQLQLEAAYQYYRADGREQSFYSDIPNVWSDADSLDMRKTYVPNDWVYNESETNRVGLNAIWDINDIFTLRSAYLYKKDTREHTQAFPTFTTTGWKLQWMSKISPSDYIAQGAYTYLDSEFNTGNVKHKLTAGVSGDILEQKKYQKESFWASTTPSNLTLNELLNYSKPSEFNTSDYGKKYKANKSENTNIVIGDDITFNDNWSALIGANYTTIGTKVFNSTGKETSKYDKSELTPTLSLVYKPFEDFTTYATYMEALEKGTIVGSTYKNSGEILDPLKSEQYEIGAKYSISENLLLSSSLFRIEKPYEYSNKALPIPTYVQDGKRIHEGIELTVTGKITDNLTIMTGGIFLDPKIDKSNDPKLEGKKPTGTATKMAKIYAEYNIQQISGLTLTGGAYYTGSRFADNTNLQKIDAYTLFDAGFRYKTKLDKYPTTFNLNVANLTDENYWASSDTLGNPRNLAFSMKMEF